ncbi:hypothetical protein OZX65_01560 [Leuconostocaceae bacterium ESL0723]|nr:hypothetical protein OZX65_01560 [Leuconostocaceae bacterium ESL0723]
MTEKKTNNVSNSNTQLSSKWQKFSFWGLLAFIAFDVFMLVTSKNWQKFTMALLAFILLSYAALAMRYPDKFEFKNR